VTRSHTPEYEAPAADASGTVDYRGHSTWYRVTGRIDPDSEQAPLVVLHGGPGVAHNYCLAMANLARDGRAVVHYDQLGCGNSTHLPDAAPEFWTVELFVAELRNLVDALGIGGRFHLLGQSWGGMLAPEFVLADAAGVASMTICDSPASMPLWLDAANTLRARLPDDVQRTLLRHEEAGTTDSAEYEAAMQVFYARHVCRVQPFPPDVQASFDQLAKDPTVYHTMNGPSEFHVIGTIKDWQVKDRLAEIEVPALVVSGRYDEATPALQETLVRGIPQAEQVVLEESSHSPFWEERERFMDVVGDFLRRHD
jgi:L-proline amide hydrolase